MRAGRQPEIRRDARTVETQAEDVVSALHQDVRPRVPAKQPDRSRTRDELAAIRRIETKGHDMSTAAVDKERDPIAVRGLRWPVDVRSECESEVDAGSAPAEDRELTRLRHLRTIREDRAGAVREPRGPGDVQRAAVDRGQHVALQVEEGEGLRVYVPDEHVLVIGGDLEPHALCLLGYRESGDDRRRYRSSRGRRGGRRRAQARRPRAHAARRDHRDSKHDERA